MATSKKRKSVAVTETITALQFEETLAKYATNDAKLRSLQADLDKEIAQLTDEYDTDINILTKENELHLAVIKGYVVANKESLLAGKRRSFDTPFGAIGFRMGTPALKTLRGLKWDEVTIMVKATMPEYVRTVDEVDKEKIIADRDKDGMTDRLETLGIKVMKTEKFFVELKTVAV